MNRFRISPSADRVPAVPPTGLRPLRSVRLAAELLFLFTVGGIGYYLLEVLFRGYSHVSMAICGGVCFIGLYYLGLAFRHRPLLLSAALGALLITVVEFAAGVLVNLVLGLEVWSYAAHPFNLLGQVCLLFTGIWFLLCIPVLLLCRLLRERVFGRG